jgi:ABC-type dipeptide/oligopeptide/nickel transport system ATPase subunit
MKYRLSELDIPAGNPFQNDVLDRKPLVEFLAGLIGRLSGPFVLALDSPWGSGKTTLVRMLMAKLEQETFKCVYFNAWTVDYVTDPLVALVSAIDDIHLSNSDAESSFRDHLKIVKKITSAVAKRAVVAGVKVATLGILDVEGAIETLASDAAGEMAGNVVDAFKNEKELLEKFRSEVEKAVAQLRAAGSKETLIFFIDELDRCRPTFAIEMLERVKHLFDVPNIVFILSIDKSQLEASTAAVYGERINAPEYLRRFIDLEYGIPKVKSKLFTQNLLKRFDLDSVFAERNSSELQYDKKNFIETFTALADLFEMSLRARERSITRLCVVMEQTENNHYLDPILVALLLVLRLKMPDMFTRLCDGNDGPKEVMTYLSNLPGGVKMMADRSSLLIEAYLIASDTDTDRREERRKELRTHMQDSNKTSPTVVRAQQLTGVVDSLFNGYRGSVSLGEVARKIDLAASVRD